MFDNAATHKTNSMKELLNELDIFAFIKFAKSSN